MTLDRRLRRVPPARRPEWGSSTCRGTRSSCARCRGRDGDGLALLVWPPTTGRCSRPRARRHPGPARGPRVIVAMTKTDLVDRDHRTSRGEVEAMLAGRAWRERGPASRPRRARDRRAEGGDRGRDPPLDDRAEDARAFRMPVLRAFVAPGRGTVVTGDPRRRADRRRDAVEVLPPKWQPRPRRPGPPPRHDRGAWGHRAPSRWPTSRPSRSSAGWSWRRGDALRRARGSRRASACSRAWRSP